MHTPALTCSPRVVGKMRPDFHSMESLLQSPPFAGKSGEQLILALYDYFTSKVDGTYHFWPADEIQGNPRVRRCVADPLALLNVYGFAICGQTASIMSGIYRAAGFACRGLGLPGHVLTEVYFEGRWHILDIDMWTWFRTPEGHIASAFELAKNATSLILENKNKSNPCNLPDRDLNSYAKMYDKTETLSDHVKGVLPQWDIRGHTMDFHLRPGETLLRSQTSQGRFHLAQSWKKSFLQHKSEWRGEPRERYAPFRTYGNGKWTYEPRLSADYADFEAGVWDRSGVTQNATGLLGSGAATFRIQSPYLFAGKPDFSGEIITHADGSWLEATGKGDVRIEIDGVENDWHNVIESKAAFDQRIDVTAILEARYDCRIRVTLGANAQLSRLKFDGFIMTAPLALPRLTDGANEMEVHCLDKHHMYTVPWSELVDFRATSELTKRWIDAENAEPKMYIDGWQMIAPKGSGPVRVAFKFDAPAGKNFAWAYVQASVREGPPEQPNGSALLEWSLDGEHYVACAGIPIPNSPLQWDGGIDGEFVLPVRAGNLWIRITSDTPISGLEFHGHLDEGLPVADPLHITHRWMEDGSEKSYSAPVGSTLYSVPCGKNPIAHSIEMHVPSRRK